MSRCQHESFKVRAEVNRLTDTDDGPVTGYAADITVNCADCRMAFQWLGLERGVASHEPRVSFDRFELRAPITPAEET